MRKNIYGRGRASPRAISFATFVRTFGSCRSTTERRTAGMFELIPEICSKTLRNENGRYLKKV